MNNYKLKHLVYTSSPDDNIEDFDLICLSCKDISLKPTRCNICSSLYCYDCISNLNLNNKDCLYQAQSTTHKIEQMDLDDSLNDFISSFLKFYCPYCTKFKDTLEKFSLHLLSCSQSIKKCSNSNCKFKGTSQEISLHDCQVMRMCNICNKQYSGDHRCIDELRLEILSLQTTLKEKERSLEEFYNSKMEKLIKFAVDNDISLRICSYCMADLNWINYTAESKLQNLGKCNRTSHCNSNFRWKCSNCFVVYCTYCIKVPRDKCGCERDVKITTNASNFTCDCCLGRVLKEGGQCVNCYFHLCLKCIKVDL